MRYELGNLMAEAPDTSALELLGYRLMAMQKELAQLRDENVALTLELKECVDKMDNYRQ